MYPVLRVYGMAALDQDNVVSIFPPAGKFEWMPSSDCIAQPGSEATYMPITVFKAAAHTSVTNMETADFGI
jgi:hypothetical protein